VSLKENSVDAPNASSNIVVPFWLRDTVQKNARWVEKIHEYRDADGRLVFVRVRWRFADGSKDVTYRRPISSAKDWRHPKLSPGHDGFGWIPEAPKDASEYLYRLPKLWEAMQNGAPLIAWTEGESDADAVTDWEPDLPATSHHGGAGNSTAGQAEWFRGYEGEVLVCVDLDDPGFYCGVKRLDALRGLGIRARLVGPVVGKDVRDHLESGYRMGQLLAVDETTTRARAAEVKPASFRRGRYMPPLPPEEEAFWAEWFASGRKWQPEVVKRGGEGWSAERRGSWSRKPNKREW
jgi:hypothetical protein